MATVKTYKAVEIDGTKIACPSANGVSISRNLIQTSKTARTASGRMRGKNVAVKTTLKFSFPPNLTPAEVKNIKTLVTSLKFEHTLKCVTEYSEVETYKVYFGNYSAEQYGFINGRMMNQSLSFEAVEV